MSSCSIRKIVNNEAVEFIRIWQTSDNLNEVVERLKQSDIWLGREQRLGNKKAYGYVTKKQRDFSDFTTRNLARRFERYLRHSACIRIRYHHWICRKEYNLVNLNQLVDSYETISEAENIVAMTPSC